MRYISAVLAALLLTGAPAGMVHADDSAGSGSGVGIRLADAPADAADPRALTYIVDRLAPGSSVERRVEVSNTSGEELSVKIYPGAADIVDGVFTVADEGKDNELAGWTAVSTPTLTLQPGTTADVPVTINVPSDATEGERYGVVWAQTEAGDGQTLQVSRVGVRQYISVGAGNGTASDFTIAEPEADRTADGAPVVTAMVTNTGGRALDVKGTLSLTAGPGGISAGPVNLTKGVTIAPGDDAEVSVELDASLPAGPWDAALSLTSGTTTHDASATLTFPGGPQSAAAGEGGSNHLAAFITGGVLMLLAIIGAGFMARRRH